MIFLGRRWGKPFGSDGDCGMLFGCGDWAVGCCWRFVRSGEMGKRGVPGDEDAGAIAAARRTGGSMAEVARMGEMID